MLACVREEAVTNQCTTGKDQSAPQSMEELVSFSLAVDVVLRSRRFAPGISLFFEQTMMLCRASSGAREATQVFFV